MTPWEPAARSMRSTAAAITVANAIAAASWWLVFLAIARLDSLDAAGEYSIVMAMAMPAFFLLVFGIRPARLAVAGADLDSSEDWLARGLAGAAAVAVCAALFAFGLMSGVGVVLAVGAVAARFVDGIAEAPYTKYQQTRDVRPLLVSTTARSLALVVAVVVALLVSDGAAGQGLLIGAGLSLGVVVLFDAPRALRRRAAAQPLLRRSMAFIGAGLPLGVAAVLMSLTLFVPRLVLGSSHGDEAAGRFAAMTILFAVVSLVTTAASHTAIPVLARAVADADGRAAFMRTMRKLLLLGAFLGVAAVAVAATVGASLLTFVFGSSFADEQDTFVLMAIALAISCIATLLQDGLTALGVHRTQVLIFGAAALVALVCSLALIPSDGTRGAAIAVLAASSVLCLLCAVVLFVGVRRAFPPTSSSAPAISLSA